MSVKKIVAVTLTIAGLSSLAVTALWSSAQKEGEVQISATKPNQGCRSCWPM
ncbi:hypothetical protein [Oleisolibacter albus]|uniref:hypothetical protein n=1 Tax=Oleisolibacter albus TaxID=2171757 RepID=UPI0012D84AA1|nr:hypothetical protein [Oleisolibacter albus]